MAIKDLTSWHIEGQLWCPDCGSFFDFDGTPAELTQFIEDHVADGCDSSD